MSELTEELDNRVVVAWRQFAQTVPFQKGLDWLRHNRAPKAGGTEAEMLKAALSWNAYMQALSDIEDVLTKLKVSEDSLEEEPLRK